MQRTGALMTPGLGWLMAGGKKRKLDALESKQLRVLENRAALTVVQLRLLSRRLSHLASGSTPIPRDRLLVPDFSPFETS